MSASSEGFGKRPLYKRPGAMALAALITFAMIGGLARSFAPDFTAQVVDKVIASFTVTITTPPPPPPERPKAAGVQGSAGKKAEPRPQQAPPSRNQIAKLAAPPVAGNGSANLSGAAAQGQGSGAGGSGTGPGAGGGGDGPGGGLASKAEHIGGQINNAADFPIPPGGREARIGKAVILALTISPSGRATACRVYRSSTLPDTDAAACRLAIERLRFRPATDAAGQPISSTFYWQQKFFF